MRKEQQKRYIDTGIQRVENTITNTTTHIYAYIEANLFGKTINQQKL